MRRSRLFIFLFLSVITVGILGYRMFRCVPILPRPLMLPTVSPEEAGLTWQTCPHQPSLYYGWGAIEHCFGHPPPLLDEKEKAHYGQRDPRDNLYLRIGQDDYRTDFQAWFPPIERHTLYKNNHPLKTLCGELTAHSPNITLQNMAGHPVWEFASGNKATIILDGKDFRAKYGLDAAYRPYVLNGKMIFIGRKNDHYFVVYDGQRIGFEYDHIVIAFCCETMLHSVRFGAGRYLFSGEREGNYELVEITSNGR